VLQAIKVQRLGLKLRWVYLGRMFFHNCGALSLKKIMHKSCIKFASLILETSSSVSLANVYN
jgi:hypothetical protein